MIKILINYKISSFFLFTPKTQTRKTQILVKLATGNCERLSPVINFGILQTIAAFLTQAPAAKQQQNSEKSRSQQQTNVARPTWLAPPSTNNAKMHLKPNLECIVALIITTLFVLKA